MRKVLMITAALGLLGVSVPAAYAQKIDPTGRCHDEKGRFAKMSVCKKGGPSKAVATAAADPNGPYKLDAKGKCHDVKGKMAAKTKCAA